MRREPVVAWLLLVALCTGATLLTLELLGPSAPPAGARHASATVTKAIAADSPASAIAEVPADSDRPLTAPTSVEPVVEPSREPAQREFDADFHVLRVRITDRSGGPVGGLPVALGLAAERRLETVLRATSADDGIAILRWHDDDVDVYSAPGGQWELFFPFPEIGAAIHRIDAFDPTTELVELEAPPVGRLAIQLVDERGQRIRTEGQAKLQYSASAEPRKPIEIEIDIGSDGRAEIDPIGVGLDLLVLGKLAEYPAFKIKGSGPRYSGDAALMTVPLPARGPIFVGRLLDVAGHELKSAFVSAEINNIHRPLHVCNDLGRIETSTRGSFRLDASQVDLDITEQGAVWLHLELREGDGVEEVGVLEARADVGLPTLQAGEHDVGVIQMESPRRLVAGLVVDDHGLPVLGVGLSTVTTAASELTGSPPIDSYSGFDRSDANGRFEILGFDDGMGQWLRVDATGFMPVEPRPVPVGATGIEVRLARGGSIEGSLLRDPDLPSQELALFLRRLEPSGPAPDVGSRTGPAPDGVFKWQLLPAGRFDFVITLGRYAKSPEILHVVENVVAIPGEITRDPRLQRIDLRGVVPRARVEVRDALGQPLDHGAVSLLAADSDEAVLTLLIMNGAVALPTTRQWLDLEVRAAGLRTQRLRHVAPPVNVALQPAFPLNLDFEGMPEASAMKGLLEIEVRLESIGARGPLHVGRATLGKEGDATLDCCEPGPHRATLKARIIVRDDESEEDEELRGRADIQDLLDQRTPPIDFVVAEPEPGSGHGQQLVLPFPEELKATVSEVLRLARAR